MSSSQKRTKERFCLDAKTKENEGVLDPKQPVLVPKPPSLEADDSFKNATEINKEAIGTKTFPEKLMDILSEDQHSYIVSWVPEGDSFRIHDKDRFINEVLPCYFRACKFTSFTRKLNRWGFVKETKERSSSVYHHALFRRDTPELCRQMSSSSERKFTSIAETRHLLPSTIPRPNLTSSYQLNMHQQQQQLMLQQQMEFYQMQQFELLQMEQNHALGSHFAPANCMQMTNLPYSSPISEQPPSIDEGGAFVVGATDSHSPSQEGKKEDTHDDSFLRGQIVNL